MSRRRRRSASYYPKTRPRPAPGGISARSQRGVIGETWWSQRFVEVLESFDMGSRLGRGRTYARKGQVIDLQVQPGMVTAAVQGSRSRPYEVEIHLWPLRSKDWTRVETVLAQQALFLAKLLVGEMPQEIEEAFEICGLDLFPGSNADLDTECSCPDWANPCKHIAATYYILAEAFDENPFLIFTWRGRTQEQLLANLRKLRGSTGEPAQEAVATAEPLSQCASVATFFEGSEPLSDRPAAEWQESTVPDAVLRQLGPGPVELKGINLATLLAPAYPALSREARDWLYQWLQPWDSPQHDGSKSREIE